MDGAGLKTRALLSSNFGNDFWSQGRVAGVYSELALQYDSLSGRLQVLGFEVVDESSRVRVKELIIVEKRERY